LAEPFKNMFNQKTVGALADRLVDAGQFDRAAFVADALDGLEELELKERVRHISAILRRHLAADFGEALDHLLAALPPPLTECEGVTEGFVVWPFCQFVEDHGVDDPGRSLPALHELTRRFSAEFAIRPFLISYPARTLDRLHEWTDDEDPHVRRLVSEGSRPRLPWGQRLQFLVDDPTPVLPLLEKLRDDPEEYVRRSVANNLNDIAKDNPDVVVDVCRRWLKGASKEREKLVKHALRSLIKQGHPGALEVLGFGPPEREITQCNAPPRASSGDPVTLELELRSTSGDDQRLVIDYALHFPGARGKTNRKVFKWRTTELRAGGSVSIRHTHSFRPVSTRPTLPGPHRFELLINGMSFGDRELDLALS
jgi:3-methyladenine DNA glycosylase AlkC